MTGCRGTLSSSGSPGGEWLLTSNMPAQHTVPIVAQGLHHPDASRTAAADAALPQRNNAGPPRLCDPNRRRGPIPFLSGG